VSIDDFEISAGLRARKLKSLTPPKATTRGEAVNLARAEERTGLPTPIEPGEDYEDVNVEKKVVGRTTSRGAAE
jgi:hypothetical protein